MGHLLSSTNPEAAESFNTGSAEAPLPLPPVGSVVEYVMRPGHARQGRNRFPAFVMGKSHRGSGLDLLVFIDAGDFIDEQMVERKRPGTEFHCWDWLEDASGAMRGLRATLASVHQRIGEAEDRIKTLEAVVLGDFAPPKVSIIHIMQDFENRLRDAATAADSARALGMDPAPPRKPRAAKKVAKKRK